MVADSELEKLKTAIDLRVYAAQQGYELDRKDSWAGSAVMRHPNNDKIVIKRDADGHWVYFSVRSPDGSDAGTIIDFVKHRMGLSLGATRKELRAFMGLPQSSLPTYGFLIEKIIPDHLAKMAHGATLIFVIIGLVSLGFAAGLGLYCGQLDEASLIMQVRILRLLQRAHSDCWINPAMSSVEEVEKAKAANDHELAMSRDCQAQNLTRAHQVQRAMVFLLVLGVIATLAVFARCLINDQ